MSLHEAAFNILRWDDEFADLKKSFFFGGGCEEACLGVVCGLDVFYVDTPRLLGWGHVEAFLHNAEHATADGAPLAEVDNHETTSST